MASQDSYALEVGERILVTGANGFIGSNIVDVLLSLGYIVRGTVRSEKPWLNELFKSKYGAGKFETVNLPTLDDKDALAAALDNVSGIVHVVCKIDHLPGYCEVLTLEKYRLRIHLSAPTLTLLITSWPPQRLFSKLLLKYHQSRGLFLLHPLFQPWPATQARAESN